MCKKVLSREDWTFTFQDFNQTSYPGNDDDLHQDGKHDFVKMEDVKTFVDSALEEFSEHLKEINPVEARPVSAQKLFDEIDEERFVMKLN